MHLPPLAGGPHGPAALHPLLGVVLDALREGAVARGGPLPGGGPEAVAVRLGAAIGDVLPLRGTSAEEALTTLVRALAQGAADPADPRCAAHLHTPPLALAAAADLAASALNPSLDSWDQAPAATELEALVTRALAAEFWPGGDALVTSGGTESNQLALLLARERHGAVQVVQGANAHHSVAAQPGSSASRSRSPSPPPPAPSTSPPSTRPSPTCTNLCSSPPPRARPTPARSTRSPRSPPCAPGTAPNCTSTRPTAAR